MLDQQTKQKMQRVLDDIRSGKFAEEWYTVYAKEGPASFNKYLSELEKHPIEQIGLKLRRMMWPEGEIS